MENTFTLYIQDQPGMEGEGEVREGGSVLTWGQLASSGGVGI